MVGASSGFLTELVQEGLTPTRGSYGLCIRGESEFAVSRLYDVSVTKGNSTTAIRGAIYSFSVSAKSRDVRIPSLTVSVSSTWVIPASGPGGIKPLCYEPASKSRSAGMRVSQGCALSFAFVGQETCCLIRDEFDRMLWRSLHVMA